MTANEYQTTIGTVNEDRKVHLAAGTSDQHILCRFGVARRPTATTLAEIPEDADVCAVLLAAEIAISRLCHQCFSISLRIRYSAHIKTAIAACPEG